jgi:hypothetical protein
VVVAARAVISPLGHQEAMAGIRRARRRHRGETSDRLAAAMAVPAQPHREQQQVQEALATTPGQRVVEAVVVAAALASSNHSRSPTSAHSSLRQRHRSDGISVASQGIDVHWGCLGSSPLQIWTQ